MHSQRLAIAWARIDRLVRFGRTSASMPLFVISLHPRPPPSAARHRREPFDAHPHTVCELGARRARVGTGLAAVLISWPPPSDPPDSSASRHVSRRTVVRRSGAADLARRGQLVYVRRRGEAKTAPPMRKHRGGPFIAPWTVLFRVRHIHRHRARCAIGSFERCLGGGHRTGCWSNRGADSVCRHYRSMHPRPRHLVLRRNQRSGGSHRARRVAGGVLYPIRALLRSRSRHRRLRIGDRGTTRIGCAASSFRPSSSFSLRESNLTPAPGDRKCNRARRRLAATRISAWTMNESISGGAFLRRQYRSACRWCDGRGHSGLTGWSSSSRWLAPTGSAKPISMWCPCSSALPSPGRARSLSSTTDPRAHDAGCDLGRPPLAAFAVEQPSTIPSQRAYRRALVGAAMLVAIAALSAT